MAYADEVAEHLAKKLREALTDGDLHLMVDALNNDDLAEPLVKALGFTYNARERKSRTYRNEPR